MFDDQAAAGQLQFGALTERGQVRVTCARPATSHVIVAAHGDQAVRHTGQQIQNSRVADVAGVHDAVDRGRQRQDARVQ